MFLTIKKIPKNYWSSKKPFNLKPKSLTIFYLILGLTVFGFGEGLLIVSYSGASPWSVLAQGISLNVNLSIGVVTFIVSVCILSLWFLLKQKPILQDFIFRVGVSGFIPSTRRSKLSVEFSVHLPFTACLANSVHF